VSSRVMRETYTLYFSAGFGRMPDLDQIKQGEQGLRDRHGRFGESKLVGAIHDCEVPNVSPVRLLYNSGTPAACR
jgi:hypothetical protein